MMLRKINRTRVLWFSFFLFTATELISCAPKITCPAYMNGAATGTSGSSSKPRPLFPKNMKKYAK